MVLFGTKKITAEKKVAAKPEKRLVVATSTSRADRDLTGIIKHLRITEKSSMQAENGVYSFQVADVATKRDVAQAVRALYNVTPVRVTMTQIPAKRAFVKGTWGVRGGGKKAYVHLKKGETIEFV